MARLAAYDGFVGHQEPGPHGIDELLGQAQKMDVIGRIAPGVTHELNNSLAAILAFGQLLRTDDRLPDELRRDADLLLVETDRTRRLVKNLLDFLRQRPPERHPTNLGPLVACVLELEAYGLPSAGISVDVDIPPALPAVPLDRSAMQQVLLNLTLDAIDAIRSRGQPGRIAITAREAALNGAPAVRLAIGNSAGDPDDGARDTIGDSDTIAFRVSSAIVAAHGGTLAREASPDGNGSARVVTLPVGLEEDQAARESTVRDGRGAGDQSRG